MRRYRFSVLIAAIFLLGHIAGMKAVAALQEVAKPIGAITVLVSQGARNDFLQEVKKFADSKAFAIRVGQPQHDDTHFLLQMWREDIKITVLNPFDDPSEFRVYFYQNDAERTTLVLADALLKDFSESVSKIYGVVISENN
jgi:hypothetical protein